ncbi:MAG: BamA/TamA family outer membrane protein [Holosporales bacterium]|nr:BamA/TamA family outer membrane protein [Holosporales bacterium]
MQSLKTTGLAIRYSILKPLPAFLVCSALINICRADPALAAEEKHIFHYKVVIKKVKDNKLLPEDFWGLFKHDSKLFMYSTQPVRSLKLLNSRAKQDVKLLKLRIRAYGHFADNVSYTISADQQNHALVTMIPDFGPVFKIADVKVNCLSDKTGVRVFGPLKPLLGKPASYTNTEAAAYIIEKTYGQQGYPLAQVTEKIERINRKSRTVTLEFSVIPGQFLLFGETHIKVSNHLNRQFIENRIAWKPGEPYDVSKIEKTTKKLLNTQMFSYVDIQGHTDKSGKYAPVTVNLINDKQRVLELGGGLSTTSMQRRTSSGFRLNKLDGGIKSVVAKASWTHFNMFGGGERFRTSLKITPASIFDSKKGRNFESSLDTELMQPDVLKTDNAAIYHLKWAREPTYVYLKQGVLAEGLYEIPIESKINVRAGLSIEFARTHDFGTSNVDYALAKDVTYAMPGIPIYFIYNSYDHPLNPSSGFNISVVDLPQYGKVNYAKDKTSGFHGLNYLEGRASVAQSIDTTKRFIVAAWTALKQVSGLAFTKLPLDKRLYAGGMNSVRGYSDQMAGPIIDKSTEPMGGRSTFELGAELRVKITSNIGLVSFLEGAKVAQSLWPVGGNKFYKGWGVGFRYYTSIGPVRADFAFPCQKRKGIDSAMQFLISLGQAF